jgi:hypothetical protein
LSFFLQGSACAALIALKLVAEGRRAWLAHHATPKPSRSDRWGPYQSIGYGYRYVHMYMCINICVLMYL